MTSNLVNEKLQDAQRQSGLVLASAMRYQEPKILMTGYIKYSIFILQSSLSSGIDDFQRELLVIMGRILRKSHNRIRRRQNRHCQYEGV